VTPSTAYHAVRMPQAAALYRASGFVRWPDPVATAAVRTAAYWCEPAAPDCGLQGSP
jgi:hypothetical protein